MLGDAIQEFLRYLAAERQLAPRTVEAYGYDLQRFRTAREAGREKALRLRDVTDYDLKDYLATLKEDCDLKPTTMGRVVSSLRAFFSYAKERGLMAGDPSLRLRSPKKPRKLPVYLLPDEARRLVHATDPADEHAVRDRTILLLFLMTGIRLSELVGIDVGDLDFERGTIKVLGKGRKERLVPMNSAVQGALRAWLREHPGQGPLFRDGEGNRLRTHQVQYLAKRAVRAAGLDPRVSPHKLRHTFATTLYGQDVDLRDIQDLLGHASIASTSVYTHTNVEKVRAAVNKLKLG